MKKITGFIRIYFMETDKSVLVWCSGLITLMIFCNYEYGVDRWISHHDMFLQRFVFRYILSLVAFMVPYAFYQLKKPAGYFQNPLFILMLVLAPAIFTLKMALVYDFRFTDDSQLNHYWNRIIFWPFRLAIISIIFFLIWKRFYRGSSFFGLTLKNFEWKPYAWMLVIMLPLVAAASSQPDFLHVYPKLKMVEDDINSLTPGWLYKLLFELSYGSDFISIELFFRGFLILGFLKWVGKDAIIPMACFYCTIHFGKPLGECISSWFGGILLGIVVYHTRSIFGGLMVHLGIAWLMELGGYIGNT